MTDPCDDSVYKGLNLSDFLRHFVPQVDEQNREIEEINKTKFKPFLDATLPETLPPSTTIKTRSEKRADKRKQEKAKKKLDVKQRKKLQEKMRGLRK